MSEALDTLERLSLLERKVVDESNKGRKTAATFLGTGVTLALSGFFFAFFTGCMKFWNDSKNDLYPSGLGYFPPTVSEMVMDFEDVSGRVFFGFEMTGGIFVFLSYYPFKFRSVYFGEDIQWAGLSLSMWRQILPWPGIMLVAMIPTTALLQATLRDYVTMGIHGLAAMSAFAGYPLFEAKILGVACLKAPESAKEYFREHRSELCWRKFWLFATLFFLVIFVGLTGLVVIGLLLPGSIEHPDVFKKDPRTGKMVLADTATGTYLTVKLLSYLSEVMLGCCALMSHMCIWYYAPERHLKLEEDRIVKIEVQSSDV